MCILFIHNIAENKTLQNLWYEKKKLKKKEAKIMKCSHFQNIKIMTFEMLLLYFWTFTVRSQLTARADYSFICVVDSAITISKLKLMIYSATVPSCAYQSSL